MYIIVSPAITMITGKDLKIDYSKYKKYFNTSEISQEVQVPTVEDTYKTELNKKLKRDIEELGYNVSKINADIDLEKRTNKQSISNDK